MSQASEREQVLAEALHQMKLGEVLVISMKDKSKVAVERAPGGWLYIHTTYKIEHDESIPILRNVTFVPWFVTTIEKGAKD